MHDVHIMCDARDGLLMSTILHDILFSMTMFSIFSMHAI